MRKTVFVITALFVFFVLMGLQMVHAQVQTYSINERFGWGTGLQQPAVTSPTIYDKAYSPFNVWQGGVGEGMQSMLYFYRTSKTPLLFSDAYDAYVLKVGDLRFADYTQANHPLSLDIYGYGRMPFYGYDAVGHLNFSAAVSPNISLGVEGNYMASSGVKSKNTLFNQVMNLGVWTAFDFGNYDARLSATINDISHNYKNSDTIQYKHHTLHFTHNWKFGNAAAPTAKLIHTTRWEGVKRGIKDPAYDRFNAEFQIVRNTLAVQVLRENVEKMPFSLVAFFEHDYRFHGNYIEGQPVLLKDTSAFEHHDNNLQLGFNISDARDLSHSKIDYSIVGNVFFWGPLQSECNLDIDLAHSFKAGNVPMRISYGVGGHRDSNTKFLGKFYFPHTGWENSFDYWHRVDGRFGFDLPKQGISFNIKTDNIHQPVYMGRTADGKYPTPYQKMGWLSVVAADLKANIDLHRDVRWENQFIYQFTSDKSVLPLPDFTLYSKLYYHHQFEKWGLKAGVDLSYYTPYYANGYDEKTGVFYVQNTKKMGMVPGPHFFFGPHKKMLQVPDLGFFAEVQPVKGLTVFASFDHWLGLVTGRGGYSLTPSVMDEMYRLNVGLRWQLVD